MAGNNYTHGNNQWADAGVTLWSGPRMTRSQVLRVMRAIYEEVPQQYPGVTRAPGLRHLARQVGPRTHVRDVWLRQGITRLVHDLSHRASRYLWPDVRPHDPVHAALERHLIAFAIRKGYHRLTVPAPKPKASKPSAVDRRAAQAKANLARAERRLKLAQTLAKKWRAKVRYYAKGKRVTTPGLQP